jgi:hypothetical protein
MPGYLSGVRMGAPDIIAQELADIMIAGAGKYRKYYISSKEGTDYPPWIGQLFSDQI